MDDELHWYAVLTGPNAEAEAAWKLKRQGYSIFFPRRWVTWNHRGKTTTELRPLLSRYLFVAVQGELQSVGAINDTDGVSRVLTMGGEAYVMPQSVLDWLRRVFGQDGVEEAVDDSAEHVQSMIDGLGVDLAAVLFAAFGRVHSIEVGRLRQPRQKRGRKSRRARDLTEAAEEPINDTETVCLVPVSSPPPQRKTAGKRQSMASCGVFA